MSEHTTQKKAQLIGGVHRDVTGRAGEPLRFYLTINRQLASGKLDDIEVDERALLRLVSDAVLALDLIRQNRDSA